MASWGGGNAVTRHSLAELDARQPDNRETNDMVTSWLSTLPMEAKGFIADDKPPELTRELFYDYLNWCGGLKERYENAMEEFEREYRRLGLLYHDIPLKLRKVGPVSTPSAKDPSKIITAAIDPYILKSLRVTFELQGSRADYIFFARWRAVEWRLSEIDRHIATAKHFHLRDLPKIVGYAEERVNEAKRLISAIEEQLKGVATIVRQAIRVRSQHVVASQFKLSASLGDESGEEGMMYRRWVGTFPEVQAGQAPLPNAERALRNLGAAGSLDWRNGYRSWMEEEKEEGTEEFPGLGAMLEAGMM